MKYIYFTLTEYYIMSSGFILDWDTRDWRPALVPPYPAQVLLHEIKILR